MEDKGKMKFEDVQNHIENLKNIDGEFGGETGGKLLNTEANVAAATTAATTAAKSTKELFMSTLTGMAAIALLSILSQILFPWWTIAIVGLWVGYWIGDTPARSFFYGFTAMFLIWSIYAGYQSVANGGLMTNTISGMLGGKLSGTQLIYATGTIGGTVSGLATTTGAMIRDFFKKGEN
jgi:hypothetical protein